MPAIAVIGGQWGDEGKGKIVDYMAQDADIVVRYAGGGNAGHNVENENGKFALRTVPCGIVSARPELNVIGRGTVPDIAIVVGELRALEKRGIDISRLRIDEAAHLVMPWHIFEDFLEEERLGTNQLGTTKNGIGPCYADKIKRITAFRAGDLRNFTRFREQYRLIYNRKMQYFQSCFDHFERCRKKYQNGCDACRPMLELDATFSRFAKNVHYLAKTFGRLENLICDTRPILWDALGRGQKILLEGAQGFGLDVDHGTFPYVTSSCTGTASASQGSGVPINEIVERIAVIKAYATRVGEGPFPTEMADYPAGKIRELGHEYGTVTSRPRRIGWFDTINFKEMAHANGLTGVAITRLDILDDFPLIGIGVGGKNKESREIEWAPGWRKWMSGEDWAGDSVRDCRTWDALPESARDYCLRIACGYPIKYVSVGPARDETIVL